MSHNHSKIKEDLFDSKFHFPIQDGEHFGFGRHNEHSLTYEHSLEKSLHLNYCKLEK